MKKHLFILLLFCPTFIFGQNFPSPTPNSWVTDEAKIFKNPNLISSRIDEFRKIKDTKIQIAVVSIKSLEGYDIADYSNQLFKKFGIGQNGANNGLLILIAKDDRKWRIEVGYGLEEFITDYDAKILGERSFPNYFRQGKFDEGVMEALGQIESQLIDAVTTQTKEKWTKQNKQATKEADITDVLFILGLFLSVFGIPFGILLLINYYKLKKEKRKEINEYKEKLFKSINSSKGQLSLYKKKFSKVENFLNTTLLSIETKLINNEITKLEDLKINIQILNDFMSKFVRDLTTLESIKSFIKLFDKSALVNSKNETFAAHQKINYQGQLPNFDFKINQIVRFVENLKKYNFNNLNNLDEIKMNYNELQRLISNFYKDNNDIIGACEKHEKRKKEIPVLCKSIKEHKKSFDKTIQWESKINSSTKSVLTGFLSSSNLKKVDDISKSKISNDVDEVCSTYLFLTNLNSEIELTIKKALDELKPKTYNSSSKKSSSSSSSSSSYDSDYYRRDSSYWDSSSSSSWSSSDSGSFEGGDSGGGGSDGSWD